MRLQQVEKQFVLQKDYYICQMIVLKEYLVKVKLGHISNKDTYLLQFIILGNFAINIIIAVFSAIKLTIIAISTSDKKGELGFLAFFALIPTMMILILSLWTRIGIYLVMWSSRSQEYHADQILKELDIQSI